MITTTFTQDKLHRLFHFRSAESGFMRQWLLYSTTIYPGEGKTVINETLSIRHEHSLLDKKLHTASYYSELLETSLHYEWVRSCNLSWSCQGACNLLQPMIFDREFMRLQNNQR